MSNMGYCRFENTVGDLWICYDHINDELDDSEKEARKELIQLCRNILSDYDESVDEENGDEDDN